MFTLKTPISFSINPFFLIVAFFLGFIWSNGNVPLAFMLMGIVTISVLVHELGHAFAGMAFNQKVSISLLPFGGLTERKGRQLKSWEEFTIVLMGPVFGFFIYLAASYFSNFVTNELARTLLIFTASVNFFWTILNLLPVMPLDGGQLMRVILQGIWGSTGLKLACILSMVFGSIFAVYFIVRQDFFIAAFFGMFIYESWQIYSSVRYLRDKDSDVSLQRLLTKADKAKAHGEDKRAQEIYTEITHHVNEGLLYNHATQNLAEYALLDENPEAAFQLLYPIRKELNLEGLLLFYETAIKGGHWDEALEAGSKIFEQRPRASLAASNARAAEQLGRVDAAAGWQKAYERLSRPREQ